MDQLSSLNHLTFYGLIVLGMTTGLLGSSHCVGMCGAIVTASSKSKMQILSYHIGRLLGYLSLGVLIPYLGIEMSGIKENGDIKLISALLIGGMFIFIGLKDILKFKSSHKLSANYQKLYKKSWTVVFNKFYRFEHLRSFFIGSLSSLLPCGLLWIVLIMSLTTANPFYSLAFIASFWLGTTPALSFAPLFIRKFIRPLSQKMPRLIPSTFILLGIITISYRIYNFYFVIPEGMSCH